MQYYLHSYMCVLFFLLKRNTPYCQVEVLLSGMQAKAEDAKSETTKAPMEVLPPSIIKQGMNLTKEQHGEVKVDGSSIPCGSDDKKSNIQKDAQSLLVRTLQR